MKPRGAVTVSFFVALMLSASMALFCAGKSYANPQEDIIYVSDVDDTIVQSNVANKLALVKTALLRKPKNAFDGMADLYNNLLAENPNARLIYLSGTPELMRGGLTRLLEKNRFPRARMILRRWYPILSDLTWGLIGDTILSSRKYKIRTLRKLFAANPTKKFVLIGDDVEFDADVYRQMAREFPSQVRQIYIRRVLGRLELEPGPQRGLVRQFSTEWHIGYSEYEQHRLSGDGLLRIGTNLLERARTQPHLVYPRFMKSFIGFPGEPSRSDGLSFLAGLKALVSDLTRAITTIAHCQILLTGGGEEPPPPPPTLPPAGNAGG